MILLAAFAGAARRATPARTTSLVGTPVAGRNRRGDRGADRLLRQHPGAARATSPATPAFRELLGAGARDARSAPTRTRTCRSSSWSRSCAPEREPAPHAARSRSLFALQNAPPASAGAGRRSRLRRVPPDDGTAKFDLTLGLDRERDGGFAGHARVRHRPLRRAPRSRAWLGHFETLLAAAAGRRRSCRCRDLPLLAGGRAPAAPRSSGTTPAAR